MEAHHRTEQDVALLDEQQHDGVEDFRSLQDRGHALRLQPKERRPEDIGERSRRHLRDAIVACNTPEQRQQAPQQVAVRARQLPLKDQRQDAEVVR